MNIKSFEVVNKHQTRNLICTKDIIKCLQKTTQTNVSRFSDHKTENWMGTLGRVSAVYDECGAGRRALESF